MLNKLLNYTPNKSRKTDARRNFLLSFFSKPDKFDSKEVNGFILNRYFDTSNKRWGVMVFTQESWKKAQDYLQHKDTPIKSPQNRTKFQNLFDELSSAVVK